MSRWVNLLARVRDLITDGLAYIGAGLLTLMCFIISYDVVARYFFNRPTDWASGITEWILLFATWGGAALVLKEKGHTIIDVVTERLTPKGRTLANFIASVIGAITCAFVFWASFSDCVESISYGSKIYIQIGYIQRWIVLGIIPVGSLWLLLYFAREAGQCLSAKRGEKTNTASE